MAAAAPGPHLLTPELLSALENVLLMPQYTQQLAAAVEQQAQMQANMVQAIRTLQQQTLANADRQQVAADNEAVAFQRLGDGMSQLFNSRQDDSKVLLSTMGAELSSVRDTLVQQIIQQHGRQQESLNQSLTDSVRQAVEHQAQAQLPLTTQLVQDIVSRQLREQESRLLKLLDERMNQLTERLLAQFQFINQQLKPTTATTASATPASLSSSSSSSAAAAPSPSSSSSLVQQGEQAYLAYQRKRRLSADSMSKGGASYGH